MTGPYRDLGDGPPCPASPDGSHGRTYDMVTCFWCPVDGARFEKIDDWKIGGRLTRAHAPSTVRSRSATQHAEPRGSRQ